MEFEYLLLIYCPIHFIDRSSIFLPANTKNDEHYSLDSSTDMLTSRQCIFCHFNHVWVKKIKIHNLFIYEINYNFVNLVSQERV